VLHPAAEGTTLLRNVGCLFTQRHSSTAQKIRNLQDNLSFSLWRYRRTDANSRIWNVWSKLRGPWPSATWLLLVEALQLPVRPPPGSLSNKNMVRYWNYLTGENPNTRRDTWATTKPHMDCPGKQPGPPWWAADVYYFTLQLTIDRHYT